jgi:hypothetical protein
MHAFTHHEVIGSQQLGQQPIYFRVQVVEQPLQLTSKLIVRHVHLPQCPTSVDSDDHAAAALS